MSIDIITAASYCYSCLSILEVTSTAHEDAARRIEEIICSELINLYRRIFDEALEEEIHSVLNVEKLTEGKFFGYALRFLARLFEHDVISKNVSIVRKISRLDEEKLEHVLKIFNSVCEGLVRKVVETGFKYSEYVGNAIYVLFNRDKWVISKIKKLGYENFIQKLLEEIRSETIEFIILTTNLTFAIVSTLAALFRNAKFRVENLERLALWCKDFAEELNDFIEVLDSRLLSDDPQARLMEYLSQAKHLFEEAREFINRAVSESNPVLQTIYVAQACEKLYKMAEDCIKVLEAEHNILKSMTESELEQYMNKLSQLRRNREKVLNQLRVLRSCRDPRKCEMAWTSMLYTLAAYVLGEKISREVWELWRVAYDLHLRGFHCMDLTVEEAKDALRRVEDLFRKVFHT